MLAKPKSASQKPAKQFRILNTKRPSIFYRRNRKRLVRYGLIFGNLAIVLVAVFVVVKSSGGNAANYSALSTAEEARTSNPLDTLSATEIAANVALMARLPETEAILSDSNIEWAALNAPVSSESSGTVALSQILSGGIKTKEDIVQHTVVEGDTLETLAAKYGVTSDSIKWSNGLSNARLRAGLVLNIPPVNGIVHKVAAGDTVQSLAGKYHSSEDIILRFNDAEISGLKADELIVIPGGEIRVVAAARPASSLSYRSTFSSNASFITRYTSYSPYGIGGYGRGWCTDWASYRSAQLGNPVGNWGNARSWLSRARSEGYYGGPVPKVGAVVYFHMGGLGHVGVVEEVSDDRSMIKFSDMNGIAGWGNAAKTNDWMPASGYSYIYR